MRASATETLTMRLVAIRQVAHETNIFEFRGVDNAILPPVAPGAHVDLHLPNGMVRSYSLINSGDAPDRYIVGVKRDAAGRGGSVCLHDTVRVGAELRVSTPRNNFPLLEDASHSVLIAGGIGITPIWSMAQRLLALGKPFSLHYACRTARDVAFADDIAALDQASLHIDEDAGGFLDISRIVASAPEGSHFYCCGPAPMLTGFEAATADLPGDQVHLERFSAVEEIVQEGGFTVAVAGSDKEFAIPEGKSILEVLREAGFDLDFSCEQGICGACRVGVVEGEPDHKDWVLSDDEKERGDAMMICCSGAKSPRLTIAL